MANYITMTDVRLVADPELRFTPGGDAVGNIRIVDNKRKKDESGNWVDGSATWLTCVAWRQMAERIVEDLKQGDLLNISGELVQRDYTTKEGEKRSVYEIQLASVGKSLRWLDKEKQARPDPSRARQSSSFDDPPPF